MSSQQRDVDLTDEDQVLDNELLERELSSTKLVEKLEKSMNKIKFKAFGKVSNKSTALSS